MLFGRRWCNPASRKADCDSRWFNNSHYSLSLRLPVPDLRLHFVSIVVRSLSRLVRPNLRSIQEEESPSFSFSHP
jgi:hypothetical protein